MNNELRYVLRGLRRSPGFAAAAVLTLALGIGANTAIFSVVNTVLLRPLPVDGLDRLAVIRRDAPALNLLNASLAPPEVLDLTARTEVFEAVTGFRTGDRTLTGEGDPARLTVAETLGEFAAVFRVRPHLGRFYQPERSAVGPHEVAVLSYGMWQQLSGGDPSFIGRTIRLDGVAHEVIGVLPRDFRYPRNAQLLVPFRLTGRFTPPGGRGIWIMTTVARVHPHVTEERLGAQLAAESERWRQEYTPGAEIPDRLHATGMVEYLAGPLQRILLVLMGAVVFVLAVAAANVASLQLVRAVGRAKEIGVRAAMGAGRARLLRHLLLESVVLAIAGGALGLWLGVLSLELLERWAPAQRMYLSDIPLDGLVLAFTALVAFAAAIAFGILPALRGSRVEPQEVLSESHRGTSAGPRRSRLLQASVAVQLALALLLVLGSGLMIRTLARLLAADPGFEPAGVVTAQITIPASAYDNTERRVAFFDAVLERLRAQPVVQDAALVWGLPFTDQLDSSPFQLPGREASPGDPERHAQARIVSPGYFRTMGIPLLGGGDFTGTERPGSPLVAVIDQTFAEQFFPGEDPVGRQILAGYFGNSPVTIIGVVGRVDHREIGDALKAVTYFSYRHQAWSAWRSIVVRSAQPAAGVADLVRSVLAEVDPNVPVYDVQPMEARIEQSFGPRRLALVALGAFAALSVLLAALGVYGVMRYTTSQRTKEIGIRLAIGAEPRDVLRLVIRQGMVTAAVGLAAGLLSALALTRFMSGILFGVSPHDPVAFLAATALLGGVGLVAIWLPAHRAARTDPMVALRHE